MTSQPLKIAIDAQILPNSGAGGIESVVVGLISALGKLEDGPEQYTIIGPWQNPDWLSPYIGPNQKIISGPKNAQNRNGLKKALGPFESIARRLWRQLTGNQPPMSNGFYESLNCNLVHFPYQNFVICSMPTVYNPHDLQFLHFPEFFSPSEIYQRDHIVRAGCHFSGNVVVGSRWVKEDLVRAYGTDPDKIQVIPWSPPTQVYQDPTRDDFSTVVQKYSLNQPYAYYPAMLWYHKNHLRLLDALALLRDRDGLIVNLVSTGHKYPEPWRDVQGKIQAHNLNNQVQFLGLVPKEDLRAIYGSSQFVFVPTLFEAASGPVFEAWQESVPAACSAITSLPEQAGDAALLFDPYSVESIAEALKRMTCDKQLVAQLQENASRRLADFSWERTARTFRAVYRRAVRQALTEEDRDLLDWDWMGESRNLLKVE